jgi:hypothetical protein
MKTRIQDLDDKVFQDLISDQLCKGDLSRAGEVSSITLYVIQLVSELGQVGSFLQVLGVPIPIKLTATI